MNVDEILKALNANAVDYLLIGGMNFLIRHIPELAFDVDIWVADQPESLEKLNRALSILWAEWGRTVTDWAPVPQDWRWLHTQPVFCLTTAHGALDVFREVKGLDNSSEPTLAKPDPGCHSLGFLTFAQTSDPGPKG